MKPINVAIVGCGLIGKKRANALKQFGNCRLVAAADINEAVLKDFGMTFGCETHTNWQNLVARDDVDAVVIATVNKHLLPISDAAFKNKKHVLCEKPLGRNYEESRLMVESAKGNDVILKTGFNHRHHPAVTEAKRLLDAGAIGDIIFIRCRYGHGGRPGYDKEWRADSDLCGGGELLDQGVHVVDLFRWLAGDFDEAFGYVPTYFWDMKVEDNAFAMFRKNNGVVATMHTSWTQWKNLFSFEIFGRDGYLIIDGLGGSYGTETLKVGTRNKEGGAPTEEVFEFHGEDVSWINEWREFISAIEQKREPLGSGWDGLQANKMIGAVYLAAENGRVVGLGELD